MNIIGAIIRKVFYRTAEKNVLWYKKHTDIQIGENCHIFPGANLSTEPCLVSIGNNVTITNGARILTHDGGVKVPMNMGLCKNADLFGKVTIGNNVFIGVNAIIMPGVTIGDNCVIGAGAIVTKDIPSNSCAAGVPAKVICSIKEYYEHNKYRIFETDNMTSEEKNRFLIETFGK